VAGLLGNTRHTSTNGVLGVSVCLFSKFYFFDEKIGKKEDKPVTEKRSLKQKVNQQSACSASTVSAPE
jgi:hypothetical protein